MSRKTFLSAAAACALAAAAPAQQIITIAEESFDYPAGTGLHDLAGGIGWANAWWSNGDPANSAGVVAAPGIDNVGNLATNAIDNAGSFRFPAVAGFEHMADANLLWGNDGTTMWISLWTQRTPGGDDGYGGLSLIEQFVSERIFLGCPNSQEQWGLHDDPNNNPAAETVFGTDPDVLARLVYRIDFQAGQERLRLWIDPPVPHPDTVADIDTMIADLRWNELRIQSGNALTLHGWLFDGIKIETFTEGAGTAFCFGDGAGQSCPCGNDDPGGEGGCANGSGAGAVLSATGGQSVANDTFKLWARNLIPFQPCLFFQGDNAINSGNGILFGDGLRCAGQNVIRLQVVVPDSGGFASTSAAIAAGGLVNGGDTKYYQCWYRDPAGSPCGSTFNLSNGLQHDWLP